MYLVQYSNYIIIYNALLCIWMLNVCMCARARICITHFTVFWLQRQFTSAQGFTVLNWTSLYDPTIKTFNELGITDSSRKSCFKTVVFIIIIIFFFLFIREHIIIIIIVVVSMYTHVQTIIIIIMLVYNGKFDVERYQKLLRCFISAGRYECWE